MTNQAIKAIEAQQEKLTPNSPQWVVGEQLKDICRREPSSAELILQDLQRKGMGLSDAEGKIRAYADAHRTGSFAFVSPAVAEQILREFYGLPAAAAAAAPTPASGALDLSDFL